MGSPIRGRLFYNIGKPSIEGFFVATMVAMEYSFSIKKGVSFIFNLVKLFVPLFNYLEVLELRVETSRGTKNVTRRYRL